MNWENGGNLHGLSKTNPRIHTIMDDNNEQESRELDEAQITESTQKKKSYSESNLLFDSIQRLTFFIGFHLIGGYLVYSLVSYYLYEPLGGSGFWKSTIDLILLLFLGKSLWDSWDKSTIQLNEKAEILYFNKPVYSNVEPGFVCLGLPKWLGASLETVDCKKVTVTVGLVKKDNREPFIIECDGFRAIFDVVFQYAPHDTRKYLLLGGTAKDVEKLLVSQVNAVIYAKANEPLLDEDKKPKINEEGEEVKRFHTIDDLKKSTGIIGNEIMKDESPAGITARLKELGFDIYFVTIKDIENEDKQIITAKQAYEAKATQEATEMLSTENSVKKVELYYKKYNLLGTEHPVPLEDRISMRECREMVERDEGTRTTTEIKGGAKPIVFTPPPTK